MQGAGSGTCALRVLGWPGRAVPVFRPCTSGSLQAVTTSPWLAAAPAACTRPREPQGAWGWWHHGFSSPLVLGELRATCWDHSTVHPWGDPNARGLGVGLSARRGTSYLPLAPWCLFLGCSWACRRTLTPVLCRAHHTERCQKPPPAAPRHPALLPHTNGALSPAPTTA